MKATFFITLLVFTQALWAQVTFIVNQLPENHDYKESIYISGDFEGWTGGIEAYKLKQKDKSYTISLPLNEGTTLYKFTLGSWQTVERDENGNQTDNRAYKFQKANDTVFVKIASWVESGSGKKSTASKNVSVLSETFKIPQLDRERRVWVYLPPGYKNSMERYPVLYVHDGQNVFDKITSYAGEWGIDESLNSLFRTKNFKMIVVGIDNGGDKRMTEYSPWDNERFGKGEGASYVKFIVKDLKPYIDKNFRTLTDHKNTGIMGSSMGGLISHYAGLAYPQVFGKVGVFSPSFWYSNEAFAFAKSKSKLDNVHMYFLMGGKEGDRMIPDMNRMIDLMKQEGFNQANIYKKIVDDGKHNEQFWQQEFKEAILWLFPDALKPQRTFKSASLQGDNTLKVSVSDGHYAIQFYTNKIVETTFIPAGQDPEKGSHAVVLNPLASNSTMNEAETKVEFSFNDLTVAIQKAPFKISYHYKGNEVTSEKNGYRKIDDLETIQFSLSEDEVLYGGGARALGMNRRGHRLQLYNKAHYGYESYSKLLNYSLPLVVSSDRYMIHFDNAPIGFLDLDGHHENTLTYETISGRKTYQVIVGDNWYDLIDNYTDLTGKQPMIPRWALGNFSSRFGYRSENETRETVQKFKDDGIPLDAVILDIYWFGKDIKGHMGGFEFLKDSFPNPEKMIKDFKDQGVQTILITEPYILTTSKKWQEAVDQDILAKDSIGKPFTYDIYFGNTGLIDIYDPKAEKWFWNIYKGLANKGTTGVWGDLGEPEVHPSEVLHASGTADEVHNIYGHDWARLVFEGYQRDFPKQRPFILMRAGYSGSQRYGLIPWSGDVNRTWGGLKPQPEIAIQMAMQGLGFMHSDLGGFAGANLDDELYVRWLQYGIFQPIYRPHAQEEVPSEPVFRSDTAKALSKKAIELRYKLLPYNYNLSFENNQTGAPLMRPLFFEEKDNDSLLTYSQSYLWGKDILVSPVLEAGKKRQEVYFPKQSNWFDFYTGEKIAGGSKKEVAIQKEYIPTYVRGGAFIPIANGLQTTANYDGNELTVHYYFDSAIKEKSKRNFYNDDGKTTNNYENGAYEFLEFEGKVENGILEMNLAAKMGENCTFKEKEINLIIHNVDQKPTWVKRGKRKTKSVYTAKEKTLSVPIKWKSPKEIELKIKLKS
ncbi:MAG: glycoside hydrolase family 31 protein [Flavobacteriaceae bacterium]|nr:glycoside hydrolase family 31 protein [Flavobacteriaceae bacterium]